MKIKEHYENHLAEHYSWIFGGLEKNISKNKDFFLKNKIKPVNSKVALDLGAGSGFQSIPLAKIGFNVTAVDISHKLLLELKDNARQHSIDNINIIEQDFLDFNRYAGLNPELIICMGDTLSHLPDINAVKSLIENASQESEESGKMILSFRDLYFELKGSDRFIPVNSSDNIIFTCFLEYQHEYVDIYDIVYIKEDGNWKQTISSYQKLKISREQVESFLKEAGFKISFSDTEMGMIYLIASK